MPVAEPSDVRAEYNTYLEDSDIQVQIDRAEREISRYNDLDAYDQEDLRDLEAAYAAYRIATRIDRAGESVSSGRSRIDHEESVVDVLRDTISDLDKSGNLVEDPHPGGSYEVF